MPLGVVVPMGDIRDVDGYVNAGIVGLRLDLSRDDREELELYGFEIMCQLHRCFDGRGTFSGHCAARFRPRLITAWHTMNRGSHVRTRNVDGRCVWDYRPAAISFERVTQGAGFDERRVVQIGRFQKQVALAA